MIRNTIGRVTVLLASLAALATIFITPLPASAIEQGRVCQTYADPQGNRYCLGSANVDLYTHVTEKLKGRAGGRQIIIVDSNTTYDNTGMEVYFLYFASDTTKCVASTNDGNSVDIRPCNGGTGTRWAFDGIGEPFYSHGKWLNPHATSVHNDGHHYYLMGLSNGSDYQIRRLGVSGGFYDFSLGP